MQQPSNAGSLEENTSSQQKYELHIGWYLWSFFYIFFVSYAVPIFVGGIFLTVFALPAWGIDFWANFPQINPVIAPDSIFAQEGAFVKLLYPPNPPMYYFLTLPLVLVGLYLLHLYLTAVTARQILTVLRRKSPVEECVIERKYKNPNPEEFRKLSYYQARSFIMRILKWKFTKGLFPWLQNWMFRFVGAITLGKGVILEPQTFATEMTTYEDGVYIGPGSGITASTVEGIWGRVVLMNIFVGKRACASGKNILGPGTVIEEGAVLLPGTALAKSFHLRAHQFYCGAPAVRVLPKKLEREHLGSLKLPPLPPAFLEEAGISRKKKSNRDEQNPERGD